VPVRILSHLGTILNDLAVHHHIHILLLQILFYLPRRDTILLATSRYYSTCHVALFLLSTIIFTCGTLITLWISSLY